MVKFGFEHRFHDLKYFKIGIVFHIPFTIHLRASSQKLIKTHQYSVIFHILNKF